MNDLKINSNFSVLYDGKPMMKAITTQKKPMTEVEIKEFIGKLNNAYKAVDDLKEQLMAIYELHSNRNLSDAIVSIAECRKSINLFNSSLQ